MDKTTIFDKLTNLLGAPIENISHSFYDSYVEQNVKIRAGIGLKETIIRRQVAQCCDWCAGLAGTYDITNVPNNIYKRHENCKCMVTYKSEKGSYTDVWSKKEYKTQKEARLEKEKELIKGKNSIAGKEKRIEKEKEISYNIFNTIYSSNERGALIRYKSSESYTLNEKLRTEQFKNLSDADKKWIGDLDSALKKTPKYEGNLIRVVDFESWPDAEAITKEFLDKFEVGKLICFEQYISTSTKLDLNERATVHIYIEESKKGRDLRTIGLDEGEILFERFVKFRTLSKTCINGKWHIVIKEI